MWSKENTGKLVPMNSHFDVYDGTPDESMVNILGKANSLPKLLTLEALFIKELKPLLNTKDEFRSRELTLKF